MGDASHGGGQGGCASSSNTVRIRCARADRSRGAKHHLLRQPAATGAVKVIDLGQAARIGAAKTRVQGTPDYMAPEQVKLLPVTSSSRIL
jgi:serine/threonine protein kinase